MIIGDDYKIIILRKNDYKKDINIFFFAMKH
jgi:hypothetical protein